jgi:cholesterol transport system auxiliary component
MTRRRLLALLAGVPAAAGCTAADLLAGRPAPRLYELTPKSTYAEGLPDTSSMLRVEPASATAGLNTTRIALRPEPTSLDYYANALWVDVVPVMVQNLVLESLENSGRVDALGPAAVGVPADYALLVHVREFQAEYGAPGEPPQVHVRLQARLVTLPRRESVDAAGADAVAPAGGTDLDSIIRAFDEALGKTLKDIVEWTARTLAARERRAGRRS